MKKAVLEKSTAFSKKEGKNNERRETFYFLF